MGRIAGDYRRYSLLGVTGYCSRTAALRGSTLSGHNIFLGIDEEAALASPLLSAFCVLPKMPLLSESLGEKLYIANHYR